MNKAITETGLWMLLWVVAVGGILVLCTGCGPKVVPPPGWKPPPEAALYQEEAVPKCRLVTNGDLVRCLTRRDAALKRANVRFRGLQLYYSDGKEVKEDANGKPTPRN